MHSKRNPYSEDSAKVAHIDKEVSCQIHIYTFILTRLLARLSVCSFARTTPSGICIRAIRLHNMAHCYSLIH